MTERSLWMLNRDDSRWLSACAFLWLIHNIIDEQAARILGTIIEENKFKVWTQ